MQWGNMNVAKALIKAGCDLNIGDLNRFTPLIWIAYQYLGSTEIAKLLIEAGSNLNV